MAKWEDMIKEYDKGGLPLLATDIPAVEFYRMEAETWLAQAKAEAGP